MSKGTKAFRQEIVELHKEIFRRNKKQINDSVHGYTEAFKRYEQRYQRFVKSYQKRVKLEVLDSAVKRAQAVFVGDYHTLPQAQRSFLRLLKRIPKSRPKVIALEFIQGRHQKTLDSYIAGEIHESEFLKAIDHENHWIFGGWSSFKPILDFARFHDYPIIGIDSQGKGATGSTLIKRDAYAAKKLAAIHSKYPDHLILVLVGELHVAPPHLPRATNEAIRKKKLEPLEFLSIYQNAENIYWALEAKGYEHDTELVRISKCEFCIINTTPIVCQQSFLNWLDLDDELQPLEAPEQNFKRYAQIVASFFDLPIGNALDDVEITTVVDLSFLQRLQKKGDFNDAEMQQIRKQILSSESYYIPTARTVYLGNLSINHASEEATHFLRHVCSKSLEPKHLVDAFYARALEEAVGFLGSKLLNHRRKCPHKSKLERLRRVKSVPKLQKEMARLVLKHQRMLEGKRIQKSQEIYECDMDVFNAVTHIIGYQLGDRIYYGLIDGTLDKMEIRELFFDCFEEDGAALSTYLYFYTRTKDIEIPERL